MKEASKLMLTVKQEKTRAQWRLTVISMALICSIATLTITFFNARLGLIAAIFLAIVLIKLAIIWICAYRRPGTKLLSYMLFANSLNLIILVCLSSATRGISCAFAWPIMIALTWFYIASWRLRGVNKAIQQSNFLCRAS